jgi:hypothetical protein
MEAALWGRLEVVKHLRHAAPDLQVVQARIMGSQPVCEDCEHLFLCVTAKLGLSVKVDHC